MQSFACLLVSKSKSINGVHSLISDYTVAALECHLEKYIFSLRVLMNFSSLLGIPFLKKIIICKVMK